LTSYELDEFEFAAKNLLQTSNNLGFKKHLIFAAESGLSKYLGRKSEIGCRVMRVDAIGG
jgi:hypothetical protein